MNYLRTAILLLLATVSAAVNSHGQSFSVLYNFGTNPGDPFYVANPGIIAQGRDGNLYSTSPLGGTGLGTVFTITPQGTLSVLYNFDAAHGAYPSGGLTLGLDGNFYGATPSGGATGHGTVFKITPGQSLTVLHSFNLVSDGAYPDAPPVQGKDGNFYGTTTGGGTGLGTVYKITPSGTLITLHQFAYADGSPEGAPLVQAANGNFYGTTWTDGANGYGTIFKVTSSGKFIVLYNFDGTHGALPADELVQGVDGNLYGTTSGGTTNGGVVLKITPNGSVTVLHNFDASPGSTDGKAPYAGLVQATDGNFYGVTSAGGTLGYGTIYRISAKGSYAVLYNFDDTTGAQPQATLFQHTNGILYGDAMYGGANTECSFNCGTFYSLNLGLSPFVAVMSTSGTPGKTIQILGQGFDTASSVQFGSGSASFNVFSDTFMTAIVPSEGTQGYVTVTTASGTLTSNKKFKVVPIITSFTQPSGPVGTQVIIIGGGFHGATKVTFGGVKATSFSVDSGSQITATVPTGAVTGKVSVTTPGGTATSKGTFTVT